MKTIKVKLAPSDVAALDEIRTQTGETANMAVQSAIQAHPSRQSAYDRRRKDAGWARVPVWFAPHDWLAIVQAADAGGCQAFIRQAVREALERRKQP